MTIRCDIRECHNKNSKKVFKGEGATEAIRLNDETNEWFHI